MSDNLENGVISIKKAFLLVLLFCLLTGCRPQATDVSAHIVTEITVVCESDTEFTRRFYNTHKKMQSILLYLRAVSPGFTPGEDPEPLSGRVIYITLQRSDGSTKVYRQKNDRYLQEGSNPWRQIKPEWGASLYQLVLNNESDPETGRQLKDPLPDSWKYRQTIKRVTGRTL